MNKYYLIKEIQLLVVFFLLLYTNVGFAQSFSSSVLNDAVVGNPTSLQFGPDGKLYVVQQDGTVRIFTITKVGSNNYKVTNTETLTQVRFIPNHNDDGTDFSPVYKKRQSTGLLVAGTADNPLIYVSSSDYRIGAGEFGDVNLCTNSGVISKLYKDGGVWKKIDLVRGLPRSEENHAPNGMQIHNNKLLIAIGGTTNSGGPSKLWTYITEYALSAAILVIDLAAVEGLPTKMDPTGEHPYKYDLPTLDDPTRTNKPDGSDPGDPFGGNDGLNQAKIVSGGPVQIFAGGFRNAYDVLISKFPGREGRVYSIDNGPNRNWGGWPVNEGTSGNVTNEYPEGEPGSLTVSNYDGLDYIGNINSYTPGTYYGGHPCPIRANPAGAGLYSDNGTHKGWRNNNSNPNLPLPLDWPPVPVSMANPIEGSYAPAGSSEDLSLINFKTSTNGLCEYLYSGNSLYGDMLAASFDGNIYRIKMNNHQVISSMNAQKINQEAPFATGFGNKPLDITAQGDGQVFAGTIWVATWGTSKINVFEPQAAPCPLTDPNADDDNDGYSNQDEADNGTDPCSGSSKPDDNDSDQISDLNDNDDDNDGILDVNDYFAIDPDNGLTTTIPTHYNLFNYDPGTGFFGLGFTGLMCNNSTDYLTQFDSYNMISGGAAGALTIEEVPTGDAFENLNNQEYAFQFGVNVDNNSGMYTVKSAILPIFFNQQTPVNSQSQGIYIGTGDQDNYIKLALCANGGSGGIQLLKEDNGVTSSVIVPLPGSIPNQSIIFFLTIDPAEELVYPKFMINGTVYSVGPPVALTGSLLDAVKNSNKALALGIISTSRSSAVEFNATWDYIEVYPGSIISSNKKIKQTQDNINIYPNPGREKVTVNINSEISQKFTVKVFNNIGQEVKTFNINHHNSSGDYEVDINELLNGIYYLHFSSEKEKRATTVKFIKK